MRWATRYLSNKVGGVTVEYMYESEGALSVHNRCLTLTVTRRADGGDGCFEWRIRRS